MNVIAYAAEWAQEAHDSGKDYNAARADVQARATANHPVYLGIVTKITYNDKTDRYVVSYGDGSTAKCTTTAATFLMKENNHPSRRMKPTVYVSLDIITGAIDDVLLLFLDRE